MSVGETLDVLAATVELAAGLLIDDHHIKDLPKWHTFSSFSFSLIFLLLFIHS